MLEVDIGYKDGGDIVAVVPMSSDVVVFKSSGSIFRLVGEYPDWAIYEITRSQSLLTRFSIVQSQNDVFFLSPTGFSSLRAVQEYGNVKTSEEGYKVNSAISEIADTGAKVWSLPSKGQIWVRPETSEYVWVYHTINKAWTKFKMPGAVTGHASVDSGTEYISIGQNIYTVGGDDDNGTAITGYMKGKKFTAPNNYLIKRLRAEYTQNSPVTGSISTGLLSVPFVVTLAGDIAFSDTDIAYSDTDPLVFVDDNRIDSRASYRAKFVEPFVSTDSGSLTMREIILNIVEV